MAVTVYMPKNGMDMTEGTLVRWLKAEGDTVQKDEPIMEIETDKVAMEAESPADGVLLKKVHQDGDVVPVLTTLGYIGEPGEAVPEETSGTAGTPEKAPSAPAAAGDPRIAATPAARRLAREKQLDLHGIAPGGPAGEIRRRDVEKAAGQAGKATGLAKAMAEKLNLDLSTVAGTGFGGKVTKADILRLQEGAPAQSGEAPAAPADGRRIRMNSMRRAIARRMLASHTQIPPVTQSSKVDVTELLRLREQMNAGRDRGERISLTDLAVRAVAKALLRYPRFRMRLEGEEYTRLDRIDVGVAVGLEDGLLVPVVRNADQKSVAVLSAEIKALAQRARDGSLRAEDMGDACITVSNLGMYGTYSFTPIVNQPEAAIVGVCSVEDELALTEGAVTVRKKMMICVTYDHRIINGMESSLFQSEVKRLLEHPVELLL